MLVLPLAERDDAPFTVTIDLVPFLTPTRPHLEVRVGGQRWGFSGTTLADTRRVVRVPAEKGRERIALRLQIRHPLSPWPHATTATRGRSASRCWASL